MIEFVQIDNNVIETEDLKLFGIPAVPRSDSKLDGGKGECLLRALPWQ